MLIEYRSDHLKLCGTVSVGPPFSGKKWSSPRALADGRAWPGGLILTVAALVQPGDWKLGLLIMPIPGG